MYIEVRLKTTDRTYAAKYGKLNLSKCRYSNKGERLNKEVVDLERRLQRAITVLDTLEEVVVEDKSYNFLDKAVFDINDRLRKLANDPDKPAG